MSSKFWSLSVNRWYLWQTYIPSTIGRVRWNAVVCLFLGKKKHFLWFPVFEFSHEEAWSRLRWKIIKTSVTSGSTGQYSFDPGLWKVFYWPVFTKKLFFALHQGKRFFYPGLWQMLFWSLFKVEWFSDFYPGISGFFNRVKTQFYHFQPWSIQFKCLGNRPIRPIIFVNLNSQAISHRKLSQSHLFLLEIQPIGYLWLEIQPIKYFCEVFSSALKVDELYVSTCDTCVLRLQVQQFSTEQSLELKEG